MEVVRGGMWAEQIPYESLQNEGLLDILLAKVGMVGLFLVQLAVSE